ncbi:hypothetical protein S83_063097 [Arachis hypogaea]
MCHHLNKVSSTNKVRVYMLLFLQVIAVAVAIGVEIHAIFHLSCDFLRLLRASPQKYKPHLGSGETGLSFLNHSTV